jgi:hypothetical protein
VAALPVVRHQDDPQRDHALDAEGRESLLLGVDRLERLVVM